MLLLIVSNSQGKWKSYLKSDAIPTLKCMYEESFLKNSKLVLIFS